MSATRNNKFSHDLAFDSQRRPPNEGAGKATAFEAAIEESMGVLSRRDSFENFKRIGNGLVELVKGYRNRSRRIAAVYTVLVAFVVACCAILACTPNGTLTLDGLPDGVRIIVDGDATRAMTVHQREPFHCSMKPGPHRLTVQCGPVTVWEETIKIGSGRSVSIPVNQRVFATPNLVENPGGEHVTDTGQIAAWNSVEGQFEAVDTANQISPVEGRKCFVGGGSVRAVMKQHIDVRRYAEPIDSFDVLCSTSACVSTYDHPHPDTCEIQINFHDSSGEIIDTVQSEKVVSNGQWKHLTDTRRLPSGTRYVTVTLIGEKTHYRFNNAAFDDVCVVLARSLDSRETYQAWDNQSQPLSFNEIAMLDREQH